MAARHGPTRVLGDEGFEKHRRSDVSCLNNRRDTRDDTSEAPRKGVTLAENTVHLKPSKLIIDLHLQTPELLQVVTRNKRWLLTY